MAVSVLRIWLDAIRPRTLPLAIASIVVGSGLAYAKQSFSPVIFLLAIVTALLLQILSNLANDYGDHIKGTDNTQRIGPKRAMQQGLITAKDMKKALSFNILLISIFGGGLLFYALKNPHDLLTFFCLGFFAILAALFYTLGNKPYGYQGLGDLSVLIFFGWLGVLGSFYLHTGQMDWLMLLPATASGLLCVSVLNINNLRDIGNDKACNKFTLVVRIGEKKARVYHQILLVTPFIFFSLFTILTNVSNKHWLFLLAIPIAIKHGLAVWRAQNQEAIRPMLKDVVKLNMITNSFFVLPFLI